MFENEWFPKANAIGVSWHEFWKMNPRILKLLSKGHEEKKKEWDYMGWVLGQYTLSAVFTAIDHALSGKKAKSEYMGKPIFQQIEDAEYEKKGDRREYEGMSQEEKQKAEFERAKKYFDSLIERF